MAAAGTLLVAPATNAGFTEGGRYVFQKPHGGGWEMRIDDEPLADAAGTAAPAWSWRPAFFAGEVTAEALEHGRRRALFLLDVSPHADKLGRDEFRTMVDELWRADPTFVIGSEPATDLVGALGSTEDPWLAFARLRRYAPGFLTALRPVRARPRRTLVVRRESALPHMARRVDRQTAASMARSAAIALVTRNDEQVDGDAEDIRLDVPAIEESLDSAANRALLALTKALLQRTRAVAGTLQRLVDRERDQGARTSLRSRWQVRLKVLSDLDSGLRAALRAAPFPYVRRAEVSAAGLNGVAADPVYARAWGLGWRALRVGIQGEPTSERLWMSPSWEIYERWCFVAMGDLLRAQAPEWAWQRLVDPHRWEAEGSGVQAELALQPTFPATGKRVAGGWSVSRERVPDMVLTVRRGDVVRFIVIDAKYRASRSNVLDAMASAHIYQDSLRIGSLRPDGSCLLVPSGDGAPWLEDEAFQAEHRVGVHVMSPGQRSPLPRLLAQVFESPKVGD